MSNDTMARPAGNQQGRDRHWYFGLMPRSSDMRHFGRRLATSDGLANLRGVQICHLSPPFGGARQAISICADTKMPGQTTASIALGAGSP
jgi:hypothetical protein